MKKIKILLIISIITVACAKSSNEKNMFSWFQETQNTSQNDEQVDFEDEKEKLQEWSCSRCTFLNPINLQKCKMCGNGKISSKKSHHQKPKTYYNRQNNRHKNNFAYEEKNNEEDTNSFDIELFKNINETIIQLESKEINNAIIFLGPLGSGKSTTINYLLSNKLFETEIDNESVIEVDTQNLNEYPIIGHRCIAQTYIPNAYILKDSDVSNINVSLCDCPGFFDNRSKQQLFISTLANNIVFKIAENIKAIVFVLEYKGLFVSKGKMFTKGILNVLKGMFNHYNDDLYNSILFLFTKQQKGIKTKDIYNRLENCRDDFMENNDNEEFTEYINCINSILKHEHIFIVKPLDNGKSRKYILNAIEKSVILPKDNIKFIGGKEVYDKINNYGLKIVETTLPSLKVMDKLPKEIEKLEDDKLNISDLLLKQKKKYKWSIDNRQKEIEKKQISLDNEHNKKQQDAIDSEQELKTEILNRDKEIRLQKENIKQLVKELDRSRDDLRAKIDKYNVKVRNEKEKQNRLNQEYETFEQSRQKIIREQNILANEESSMKQEMEDIKNNINLETLLNLQETLNRFKNKSEDLSNKRDNFNKKVNEFNRKQTEFEQKIDYLKSVDKNILATKRLLEEEEKQIKDQFSLYSRQVEQLNIQQKNNIEIAPQKLESLRRRLKKGLERKKISIKKEFHNYIKSYDENLEFLKKNISELINKNIDLESKIDKRLKIKNLHQSILQENEILMKTICKINKYIPLEINKFDDFKELVLPKKNTINYINLFYNLENLSLIKYSVALIALFYLGKWMKG